MDLGLLFSRVTTYHVATAAYNPSDNNLEVMTDDFAVCHAVPGLTSKYYKVCKLDRPSGPSNMCMRSSLP